MKRYDKLILGVLSACLLLLTGCGPELDFKLDSFQSPSAQVSGTPEAPSLLFPTEGGNATVVFHVNGNWSAAFVNDRAKDWCLLSATEGKSGTVTITVTAKQNLTADERSASIVFTTNELNRTLVVTQKQKDALILQKSLWEIPSSGGTFELTFMTNLNCQLSLPADAASWISFTKTKGLREEGATIVVKPNETLVARQARIEVVSESLKEFVTVYQSGEEPTLILGSHTVDIPYEGDEFSLQVTSNLNVSYTILGGDWLHEVATKTISTNTYYFTADANPVRSERSCVIVFKDPDMGMEDSVRVNQAYRLILIDRSPVTLPSRSVDVSLLAVDKDPALFTVETSVPWIVCDGIVRDEEGCHIRIRTEMNPENVDREGIVRVSLKGMEEPDELFVTQMPVIPSFSYTTFLREVLSPELDYTGRGFIHWGDGSFVFLQQGASDRLVHQYKEDGPHTIVVEAESIPFLMLHEPENGVHFDFSTLN